MSKLRDRVVNAEGDPQVGERPNGVKVEVELLVHFKVRIDGVAIPDAAWKLTHPRRLLEMLCMQPGHRLHRDLVVEQLWPDSDAKAAANRLYHTVHVLRASLTTGPNTDKRSPLVFQGGMLSIDEGCELVVDFLRFKDLIAQARGAAGASRTQGLLEQAIAMMAKPESHDPTGYEALGTRRDETRRDYGWALEQLAAVHGGGGRLEAAITLLASLIEIEPSNEPAHRRLMELFDAAGQPERAVQQFIACKRYLQRDLAANPSEATVALLDAIAGRSTEPTRRLDSSPAPTPRRHYQTPAHHLPLLGRDTDLASLSAWLADGRHRLVTITAAAGMGKTRIACALAQAMQKHYRDGVLVVPLTTLSRADQLEEAVCKAAGWTSQHELASALLPRQLADKNMLLVLDRFEHLVSAASSVSEMLLAAPELQIVVTSQCRLNCQAEQVYELPALNRGRSDAAIELFMRTARVERALPQSDMAAIAAICKRLAGNPLAIELAAARFATVPLPALRSEIEASVESLANPRDDAEVPQRSVGAAIEWSIALLDEPARRLLCGATAFVGSFSIGQVHAVVEPTSSLGRVRADIQTLLEHHLLVRVDVPAGDDAPPRFALLDSIRDFARRAAQRLDWWPGVLAAHAKLFLHELHDTAKAATGRGHNDEAMACYRAAAAEIDQAVQWQLENEDRAAYLDTSRFNAVMLILCGRLQESVRHLEATVMLEARSDLERLNIATCWCTLARVLLWTSKGQAAVGALRAARRLSAGVADDSFSGLMASQFAMLRAGQLRFRAAHRHIDRMIGIGESKGLARLIAPGHSMRSMLYLLQGRHLQAINAAERGLDQGLLDDHPHRISMALQCLAEGWLWHGEIDHAASYIKECLLAHPKGLSSMAEFGVRLCMFQVAFEQRDFVRATACLDDIGSSALKAQAMPPLAVQLCREFVLMETGRAHEVKTIVMVDEAQFPLDAYLMVTYVKLHCYRLQLLAARHAWEPMRASLDKLERLVRLSGNALWASWVVEACAGAMAVIGERERAIDLLARSRELQRAGVRVSSARQLASWQQLQAQLEAVPEPTQATTAPFDRADLVRRVTRLDAALRDG